MGKKTVFERQKARRILLLTQIALLLAVVILELVPFSLGGLKTSESKFIAIFFTLIPIITVLVNFMKYKKGN